MEDNAAIAMSRDGDGQGYQLTRLLVQVAGFGIGGAWRLISTDGIGTKLCQLPILAPSSFWYSFHSSIISGFPRCTLSRSARPHRISIYRENISDWHRGKVRWPFWWAIWGVNFGVGARYGMFSGSRGVRKRAGEVTFRTVFQLEQFENPGEGVDS
jgi:hypothetical protein